MTAGNSGGRGRWSDLLPRVVSAIVMIAVGGFAVWQGGIVFDAVIALACGGMIWELLRMVEPHKRAVPFQVGAISAAAVFAAAFVPLFYVLPLLLAPVLAGVTMLPERRGTFFIFGAWVLCAGFGFVWLRNELGLNWTLWLIVVVVVTDVAGYFAGKAIGGPKFWPRVSPKKTWAGTSAGWVAAALAGAIFASQYGLGAGVVVLSVLISMASQAGDVAESALKRKMGVKDSSALIPGHGGLFDRFDGMLGAAAMFLIVITLYQG